jgi:hypothetical protein
MLKSARKANWRHKMGGAGGQMQTCCMLSPSSGDDMIKAN